MLEIAAGLLIVAGSFFMFVSALGVLRMHDLFMRMHASTKAGTLGAALVLFAAALLFGELAVSIKAVAVFLFLLLTAPVAAHVLGRAAYYAGIELWSETVLDELEGCYDRTSPQHGGPVVTRADGAGAGSRPRGDC